ncbi:outer membrane beta-barrel protein, partial [Vibrio sp. 10N.261.55.A7]
MKKVILATTLALMTASSFAASDTSGFRVGGGFGSDIGNSSVSEKYGTETTLAVEGGYDFNSIFAVNVKAGGTNYTHYKNQKDKKGENIGTMYELAVEAEAGYTFVTDSGLSLKPYVALGVVGYDKKSSEALALSKDSKGVYAAGRGAAGVR